MTSETRVQTHRPTNGVGNLLGTFGFPPLVAPLVRTFIGERRPTCFDVRMGCRPRPVTWQLEDRPSRVARRLAGLSDQADVSPHRVAGLAGILKCAHARFGAWLSTGVGLAGFGWTMRHTALDEAQAIAPRGLLTPVANWALAHGVDELSAFGASLVPEKQRWIAEITLPGQDDRHRVLAARDACHALGVSPLQRCAELVLADCDARRLDLVLTLSDRGQVLDYGIKAYAPAHRALALVRLVGDTPTERLQALVDAARDERIAAVEVRQGLDGLDVYATIELG